jgi:hypothetical protein
MARIKPLTGTDEWRLIVLALELLEADELHATRDQLRLFLANDDATESEIIAPVYHGDIATQAAMLALNASSARGCHRSDFCKRTDIGSLAICIADRGEAIGDWTFVPLAGVVEGAGRWEPMTNGDPVNPELHFDITGDVMMTFVIS